MQNLDETISLISDFIQTYKQDDNILIKFSLGKYTDVFGFEENLFHRENYNKIINLLESCTSWEEVAEESDEKFTESHEKIVDSVIINYIGSPYDILITAQTKKMTRIYKSETYIETCMSYKRKLHTYLIQTTSDYGQQNYNFELTLIPDEFTSNVYMAHSSILKINDVISCCGKITSEHVYVINK